MRARFGRLAPRQKGILLLLVAAGLWSSAGLFARLIHVESWTMQFWRASTGGLFMLGVVAWQSGWGTRQAMFGIGRGGLWAVPFSALSMICYITALQLTSVAEVMIVYATQPFVNAAIAWLLLREAMGWRTALAATVAMLGVGVTVLGGDTTSAAGSNRVLGDMFALAMVFGFSAVFLVARSSRAASIMPVNVWAAMLSAALCAPFAVQLVPAWGDIAWLSLFGCLTLGLGLTLLSAGGRLIPAGEAALITLMDVPLSPLWVWMAVGETPGTSALIGGAIVFGAVLWRIFSTMKQRPAGQGA